MRTGRPAAEEGISTSCRTANTLPGKLSRQSSTGPAGGLFGPRRTGTAPRKPREKRFQLALQNLVLRSSGGGFQVDHDIQTDQLRSALPAPEDLPNPPLDSLADHGLADLAACRDPEPRSLFVGMEVEGRQRATLSASEAVAAQELDSTPQLVAPAESLGRSRRFHRQALRRLRPLRRRLASTARPLRVFIRARKPWFFLRRRLFG